MRHSHAVSYPGLARIGWCFHGLRTRAPCRGRCGSGRFLTCGTSSRAPTGLCATAGCSATPAAAQKAPKIGGRAAPGSSSLPHGTGRSPANRPRTQTQASPGVSCFVFSAWDYPQVPLFQVWTIPVHSCSAVRNNELRPGGHTEIRWKLGRRESEPGQVPRNQLCGPARPNWCVSPPFIDPVVSPVAVESVLFLTRDRLCTKKGERDCLVTEE